MWFWQKNWIFFCKKLNFNQKTLEFRVHLMGAPWNPWFWSMSSWNPAAWSNHMERHLACLGPSTRSETARETRFYVEFLLKICSWLIILGGSNDVASVMLKNCLFETKYKNCKGVKNRFWFHTSGSLHYNWCVSFFSANLISSRCLTVVHPNPV